jgi:hypothetical protein
MRTSQQSIKWGFGGISVLLPSVLCALSRMLDRFGRLPTFFDAIVYLAFPTALAVSTWVTLTAPIPPNRRIVLLFLAWGAVIAQLLFWLDLSQAVFIYAI